MITVLFVDLVQRMFVDDNASTRIIVITKLHIIIIVIIISSSSSVGNRVGLVTFGASAVD